jgi:hypothetical protein
MKSKILKFLKLDEQSRQDRIVKKCWNVAQLADDPFSEFLSEIGYRVARGHLPSSIITNLYKKNENI